MKVKFEKIGKNRYQLEKTPEMQVNAKFFASEELLPLVTEDRSLEQLQQTAELPGILNPVIGMPDMHQGYGIPVGGVMAGETIVSSGCVGMDINCGVRLLRTNIEWSREVFSQRRLQELVGEVERAIPVGLGQEYKSKHGGLDFERVLSEGSRHLVERGFGREADLEHTEERGKIEGARPEFLSDKAKARARKQVGTLGSGNHFLELQRVEEIFNEKAAEAFGIEEEQIVFMIHSGSRALGHQTCLDYTSRFKQEFGKSRPELVPRKNLASAPVDSEVGRQYLGAMNGAINFAFANRQMMMEKFRKVFSKFMEEVGQEVEVELVYDVAHNSAKWEEHQGKKVLVHRKGATRALPPGHPKNPKAYIEVGHPALVPGSMGTPSYILIGTEKAKESYYSVNHGSGRAMSRTEAKGKYGSREEFEKQMGDVVYNIGYKKIADEAPKAYKDIELVIEVLTEIDLMKRVAKLKPLAVVKGD